MLRIYPKTKKKVRIFAKDDKIGSIASYDKDKKSAGVLGSHRWKLENGKLVKDEDVERVEKLEKNALEKNVIPEDMQVVRITVKMDEPNLKAQYHIQYHAFKLIDIKGVILFADIEGWRQL